jgi:hypothetical protein
VEFIRGSLLREFHDSISNRDYVQFYETNQEEEEILKPSNRLIYGKPHGIIRKLHIHLVAHKSFKSQNIDLFKDIETLTGLELMEVIIQIQSLNDTIQSSLENYQSETKFDKNLLRGLYKADFFNKLMKNLFELYGVNVTYESLFSDPGLFSINSLVILRNIGSVHANKEMTREEIDKTLLCVKKIRETWQCLNHSQAMKIISTLYYVLGCNDGIWAKPPKSISEIWTNYPSEPTLSEMSTTLDKLLTARSWNHYVDQQGRKENLITELKNGKIVTIYGEGATGKTELVYQALGDLVHSGQFRFEHLLPFTFKNDVQGEITDTGELNPANTQGWFGRSKFTEIVEVLSHKLQKTPTGDSYEEKVERAIDFLIEGDVCLVIDNHETVDALDPEKPLDSFLAKFSNHSKFSNTNTRIIITTRIRPDSERTGKSIRMLYLNSKEMETLSRQRAIWLASRHQNHDFHLALQNENQNHWDDLANWFSSELHGELERDFAGHPRVVFTAVYAAMFKNPNREPLKDIVAGLIRGIGSDQNEPSVLKKLMHYITSNSISYIPKMETTHRTLLELAQLHSFTLRDLIESCERNSLDYSELIRTLEDLDLIRKIEEEAYSFRTEYHSKELYEYIKLEYGVEESLQSRFTWWSEKSKQLKDFPLAWKNVQHLLIFDNEGQTSEKLKQELNLLNSVKLYPQHLKEVVWLTQQMCNLLSMISTKNEKSILLGPIGESEVRAHEREFTTFCKKCIEKALNGIHLHIESTNSIGAKNFETITELLRVTQPQVKDGEFDHYQDGGIISANWNKLFGSVCSRLPGYETATSVPLHTLWRMSEMLGHSDINHLYIGTKIIGRTGVQQDKNIVELFSTTLPELYDHEHSIFFDSNEFDTVGTFLWNNKHSFAENSLQKMLQLLANVSQKKKIFSTFDLHLKDIELRNYGFTGFTALRRECVEVWTDEQVKGKEAIISVQLLSRAATADGDEELKQQCRLIKSPAWIDGHDLSTTREQVSEQVFSTDSIINLSDTEMFDILDSIVFTEMAAANLFGIELKRKLDSRDIKGKWKDWRNHHYIGMPVKELIQKLSNSKWIVETRSKGTAATIVRTQRTNSQQESQSLQNWAKLTSIALKQNKPERKPKTRKVSAPAPFRKARVIHSLNGHKDPISAGIRGEEE